MEQRIALMATIPERTEILFKALGSLTNQVDKIQVVANGFTDRQFDEVNDEINYYNILWRSLEAITVIRSDNSYKDAAKFWNADDQKGYIFICDDDIEYPEDYTRRMIAEMECYKRKNIVTCMGKVLKPRPIEHYYQDEAQCYKTFEEVRRNVNVEIPGTCALAYHSDISGPNHKILRELNADIALGIFCKKYFIPCTVIAHSADWLKNLLLQLPVGTTSFFDTYKNNDEEMTRAVNQFL